MNRYKFGIVISLIVVLSLILGACSTPATEAPPAVEEPVEEVVEEAPPEETEEMEEVEEEVVEEPAEDGFRQCAEQGGCKAC